MSSRFEADIECPFFLRQSSNRIVCEGFVKGAETILTFKSCRKMEKHIENICSVQQGKKCPYYRMMQILYERGVIDG